MVVCLFREQKTYRETNYCWGNTNDIPVTKNTLVVLRLPSGRTRINKNMFYRVSHLDERKHLVH